MRGMRKTEMTPLSREAMEIANKLELKLGGKIWMPEDVEWVAQALEEFRQESELGCIAHDRATYCPSCERGWNNALEEAAKIAEEHSRIKGAHIHKGFKFCVEQVAIEIGALLPKADEGR